MYISKDDAKTDGHWATCKDHCVYMRLSVCLFVCGMYVEFDLVATARLCRVSHKMRITTEDGDVWVNKACKSGRIATAIKDNNNSVLYMYIGGGAVDHCL